MPSTANLKIRRVLGLVLLALGVLLLVRLYIVKAPPKLVSATFETILAIFLIARGALSVYYSRKLGDRVS